MTDLKLQRDDLEIVSQSLRDELARMFKVVVAMTLNKNISENQFEMEKTLLSCSSQINGMSEDHLNHHKSHSSFDTVSAASLELRSPSEFVLKPIKFLESPLFDKDLCEDTGYSLSSNNAIRKPSRTNKRLELNFISFNI